MESLSSFPTFAHLGRRTASIPLSSTAPASPASCSIYRTSPQFFEGGFGQTALVDGHWKAVRYLRRAARIELYDQTTDLGGMKNVAPEHPDLAAKFDKLVRTSLTRRRMAH